MTVYELLQTELADGERLQRTEAEVASLAAQFQVRAGRYDGAPEAGLVKAEELLARAREGVELLRQAGEMLPGAEAAAAAEGRSGMGKWVLFGVIALIVVIVLIGQLVG